MALVKYGHIIAEARGKLNGTVFSRGRAGAIMRTKVTPTNPSTQFQSSVRSNTAATAQAWRGLTADQRNGWNALAQDVNVSNIWGDGFVLTGSQLFMRCNRNRFTIGSTPLSAPPALPTVQTLLSLSGAAAAGAGTFTVAFSPTPVPAGHTLVIEASRQFGPGRGFFKGTERVIQLVAAAGTSPANIATNYIARFGSLIAGQKISIRAFLVHVASGFSSVPFNAIVVVAA